MTLQTLALLLLCFCVLAGCASFPPESNRISPEMAPTPFSADEIRRGCPDGRKIRMEVSGAGMQPMTNELVFSQPDAEGVTVAGQRVQWGALQAHASFPADTTEITHATRKTPAGEFDCWLYVIRDEIKGRQTERRFWFAKSLPGPPVDCEFYVDGALGKTQTMVLNQYGTTAESE